MNCDKIWNFPKLCTLLFAVSFALYTSIGLGQSFQMTNWFFGQNQIGLYFDPSGASPVTTSSNYTPFTNEGCAVANHPQSGELLFYTDGMKIIDHTHSIMPNGSNLIGNSSCFGSGKIIPDPSQCDRYMVIHSNVAIENGNNGGVYYSMVDMNLPGNGTISNPSGDVASGEKNVLITTGNGEAIEIVQQNESRNFWILISKNSTSSVLVYLYDESGFNLVNEYNLIADLSDMRGFRISPNAAKGIITSLRENEASILFDFNASTGVISNQLIIPGTPFSNNSGWYGIFDVEWSQDGSKAYLSKYRSFSPNTGGQLYQYDVLNPNNPPALIYQISNNSSNLGRGLRRGPDGVIYWIYHNTTLNNTQYLGGVSNANSLYPSCNFNPIQVNMGGDLGGVHCMPRFIEYRNTLPLVNTFIDTLDIECESNASFTFDIHNIVPVDSEGDNITIDSISVGGYSITYNEDEFSINADQFTTSGQIEVFYCDDYCYPLCDSFLMGIEINNSNTEFLQNESSSIECSTPNVEIGEIVTGYSSSWNTGQNDPVIQVDESGLYICTHTNLLNGCSYQDSILVTLGNSSEDLIPEEQINLCDEEEFIIEISSSWDTYLWQDGSNSNIFIAGTSDMYSVSAFDENGCFIDDSLLISFEFAPSLTVAPAVDTIVLCDNDSYQINLNLIESDEVLWSDGSQEIQRVITNPGDYMVTTSNVCGADTLLFTFLHLDLPTVSLGQDIVLCENSEYIIEANSNVPNCAWSTGETGAFITITSAGIYWAQTTNLCGTDADTIEIVDYDASSYQIGMAAVHCLNNETWIIMPEYDGIEYFWNASESGNSYNANSGGQIELVASTPCGAVPSELTIPALFCDQAIYAPNTFTPDNDGINDIWKVEHFNTQIHSIRIFNRYGEMIFENTSGQDYWTGNVHGGNYYVPDGVYTYQITYSSEKFQLETKTGHITIIR